MRNVLAVLASAVLCALPEPSAAADRIAPRARLQQTLVAESEAFMQHWQRGNMAGLSRILTADFLYAGPQGVSSRKSALDVIRQCHLSSYSFDDLKMRRLSAGSAVLIYRLKQDLTCFGKKEPPLTLNSDTFVRRGGKWYIVLTTQTTLSPN